MIESSLLVTDDQKGKDGKEQVEKGKKENDLQSSSQGQVSDHWKKAHRELQREKIRQLQEKFQQDFENGKVSPGDPVSPEIQEQLDQVGKGIIAAISLPVWIRERKCPTYQPSDPEYKEYVKLQSNEQKIAEIKKQVGHWAVTRLKNPIHQKNLSYIDFKGHVTIVLELVPQLHPPPLYEVPCLVVYRDGLGVGWKVLRPEIGSKMQSLLRPSIAYAAAKASFKVFFSTSYAIAKAKFSGGDAPKFITFGHHIYKLPTSTPSSVMSQKEIERDNNIPSISQWPANPSIQELLRVVHGGQSFQETHNNLIKNIPFSTAMQVATTTYKFRHLHALMHEQQRRTRGTVQVRGAIVCLGDRGKYRMDVTAIYLPAEDKFIGPLMLTNAYVVKNYSQWDKLEGAKKKEGQKKLQNPSEGQQTTASEENDDTSSDGKPTSAGEAKEKD